MADISTPLPDVRLLSLSTVTVDAGGGGAVITQLVIHGYQTIDTGPPTVTSVEPLWALIPPDHVSA